MSRTKYYIEFKNTEDGWHYSIQSKWFTTKQQAINWFKDSFDFIRFDTTIVWLMCAKFDEDGVYDDIKYVEELKSDIFVNKEIHI